jgi:dTDP-4-amino-4,6-dideoxygalactose transaminase
MGSYRVHGKGAHKYDNERIGLNSRLDTLQAAILLEKLAVYESEIKARQAVASRYQEALGMAVVTPHVPDHSLSVWAQYTVRARPGRNREAIMSALTARGVPTVVYYPRPLHLQTAYRDFPGDPAGLPVAEMLSREVFSLPMHPYLSRDDQGVIIEALIDACQ